MLAVGRAGRAAACDTRVGVGAEDLLLQLLRTAIHHPRARGRDPYDPGGRAVSLREGLGDFEDRPKIHRIAAESAWLVQPKEPGIGECIDHVIHLPAVNVAVGQPLSQQAL